MFQTKDTPTVKTKQLTTNEPGACQSTAFVISKQTCIGLLAFVYSLGLSCGSLTLLAVNLIVCNLCCGDFLLSYALELG